MSDEEDIPSEQRDFNAQKNRESFLDNKVDPRNPDPKTFLAYPDKPYERGVYDREQNHNLNAYLENQKAARQEIVSMIEYSQRNRNITPEEFERFLNRAHYIAIHGEDGTNTTRGDVKNAGQLRKKYYFSEMPEDYAQQVSNIATQLNTTVKKGNGVEDVVRVRRFTSHLNGKQMTGYRNENIHNYPVEGALKRYMKAASEVLTEFSRLDSEDKDAIIEKAAELHQILAVSHPYEAGNQSLAMNLANAMLETHGIKGIPHGITDAVAISIAPNYYKKYFKAQVMAHQEM